MGRQTTTRAVVAAIFTVAALFTFALSQYFIGMAQPGTGMIALGTGTVMIVAAIREWFLVGRRI